MKTPARGRRVAIDGFNISLSAGSGIATYGRNLASAFSGLGYATDVLYGPRRQPGRNNLLNEVAVFDAPDAPIGGGAGRPNFGTLTSQWGRKAKRVGTTGEVLWSGARLDIAPDAIWSASDVFHTANRCFARHKRFTPVTFQTRDAHEVPSVMHWTCPLPMSAMGMRNVYTLHDMVPLRLPFATLDNKSLFHAMCKRICRKADHIVTVSESAKADIIRIFGVEESRITNTYQSVSIPESVISQSDEEVSLELEGVFGLGWRRYFLFFGSVEPKKNIGRLIEAYLGSGATDPLVIIGGKGWMDKVETRLLYEDIVIINTLDSNRIRRADRVRRYEYMPFRMLVSLIRGAKAKLFPSLYEGFGLPVLEAMLLGTPVLTSTAGPLPEIAGGAALLVDPYDTISIRKGIQALDRDEGLRNELSVLGRKNAQRFSTQVYREKLGALYERLF